MFECDTCNKNFSMMSNLSRHVMEHFEKRYCCKHCGKLFHRRDNLLRHRKTICQPRDRYTGTFNTDGGSAFFNNQRTASTDTASRNFQGTSRMLNVKQFVCDHCCRRYGTRRDLIKHITKQHYPEFYYCSICVFKCYASSKRKDDLNCHKSHHANARRIKCRLCQEVFLDKKRLRCHHRNVHSKNKPYLCHICGKLFPLLGKLNWHIKQHVRPALRTCGTCGKAVNTKEFAVHKRSHTGQGPYKCSLCHKSYVTKPGLDMHRRVHTGERPYRCDVCGKSFRAKAALQKHQNSHTGVRNYPCQVCDKSFLTDSNLNTHMAIHRGIKSHTCHICGMSFLLPHHLRNHMKTHK